jgi:hypothetical protein
VVVAALVAKMESAAEAEQEELFFSKTKFLILDTLHLFQ